MTEATPHTQKLTVHAKPSPQDSYMEIDGERIEGTTHVQVATSEAGISYLAVEFQSDQIEVIWEDQ